MYFNSYLFLFLFLPIVLIGYYLFLKLNKYKVANLFLLGMSFLFYGYAGRKQLVLLVISILTNYVIYILFEQKKIWNRKYGDLGRKILLVLTVAGNLGILLLYKYYNFFVENWNMVFGTDIGLRNFIIPMGISFITFQQIAFVVDAYREEVPQCSFIEYALFVAFFPHLSSGPIITHEQFLPLLCDPERKKMDWDRFSGGMYLFAMGLGKKVLLADICGVAVDWGYSHISELNSFSALVVSILYTMQIYFDFSGYSDMAVGISRMLNLDLPVNFNSPYQANTIVEFWDRWHMTLTRFFTRYLYIPLGGSRKGRTRTWINTMIVFLCSGIWHGADWTFVLWGILHGAFMVLTKMTIKFWKKIPNAVNRIVTIVFVNFTWIIFRSDNFDTVKQMFEAVLTGGIGGLNPELAACISYPFLKAVLSSVPSWLSAVAFMVIVWGFLLFGRNSESTSRKLTYNIGRALFMVLIVVLSLMQFSGVSSFLYFNF